MGRMSDRALRIAEGLAKMPMETFEKSKYNKSKKVGDIDSPTLEVWIRSGAFEVENEKYLVDLPDYVPDNYDYFQGIARGISERYNKYNRLMFLSEKQLNIVNEIIEKFC